MERCCEWYDRLKKRKEYELGDEGGYDTGLDDGFADSGCDSEEEELGFCMIPLYA